MKTKTFFLTILLVLATFGAAVSQGPGCNDCFPSGNGGIGFPDCSNWPGSGILYVDQSIASSGDGRSWAQAMKSLSGAIQYANGCNNISEIRVARGTYKPTTEATDAGRKHTFFINRGYKITGGYPSGGGDYNPALNPTILDGDLGGGFRSYHVLIVYATNNILQPVTIDGFRVRNGAANGFGVRNLGTEVDPDYLAESSGGGAAIFKAVSVIFRNCAFYDNGSPDTIMGGAFYCNRSSVTLLNCVVARNTSDLGGGVTMDGLGGAFRAINSTFYGNTGEYGTVYNHLTTYAKFSNCIIWGNSSDWGGAGTREAEYSIIQGALTDGPGNLNSDPQFSNSSDLNGADDRWFTDDDGLTLRSCSPAINRGSNDAINGLSLTKDITGADRIHNVTIDAGAYEYQLIPQPEAASSLGTGGSAITSFVYGGATAIYKDCKVLATITPQGASPVSGEITAQVFITSPGLPSLESKVYAPRYYHLQPSNQVTSATALVTLYFTQGEFDAYNTEVGTKKPNLPKNSTDTEGNKSNLLITQFQGILGIVSGPAKVFHPDNADIVWHAGRGGTPLDPAQGYWSVTFPVTGFSGFLVSAGTETSLPVTLVSFEAQPENKAVHLSWKTTEEANNSHFLVQRSADGQEFTEIGRVEAAGDSEDMRSYGFIDDTPLMRPAAPVLYYRLKQVDRAADRRDGAYTFSRIIMVRMQNGPDAGRIALLGNPVNDRLRFRYLAAGDEQVRIRLRDISGRLLHSIDRQVSPGEQEISLSMQMLPVGLYLAEVSNGGERKVFKVLKK